MQFFNVFSPLLIIVKTAQICLFSDLSFLLVLRPPRFLKTSYVYHVKYISQIIVVLSPEL